MANDLDIVELTPEQGAKTTTINAAIAQLAGAENGLFNADVTAGNVVLTNAQVLHKKLITIIGATVAGRTVTWPAKSRIAFLYSDDANTQNVDLIRGSTTITINPDIIYVIISDGTANGLIALPFAAVISGGLYVLKAGDTMTGALQVPAGSVGAPGLRVGDADTGFWRTATKLHGSVDGVEFFRALAAGEVAFGAGYDPEEVFHIRRTAGVAINALIENDAANSGWQVNVWGNGSPNNRLFRGRGTQAGKLVPTTGDVLGSYHAGYYNGVGFTNAVSFRGTILAVTPSTTDGESRLILLCVPAASVTITEILRLDHATGLSLYGANPVIDQDRLHVLRQYTDATKPSAAGRTGKIIYVTDIGGGVMCRSDGTDWVFANESLMFALSDETTAITTGTAKLTVRMPYKGKIIGLPRANVNTVSSSGLPTVDINKNGSTILSTKLTIDASEKTSLTAAAAAVVSDAAFADDDEFTFDIDVAGTGAKGLKVTLLVKRIL